MSSNYLKSLQAVLSGVSQRQAATKNGVSRNTVALLAKYAQDKGWQVPEDLADVTEQDLKLVVQRQLFKLGRSRLCHAGL